MSPCISPLDEQKQGSPLTWQVDAGCVLEFSRTPQRSALLSDAMPADGLIAAHSTLGETSARSLSPVKGQLSKFKPFHAHEKGIRTPVFCPAGLTSRRTCPNTAEGQELRSWLARAGFGLAPKADNQRRPEPTTSHISNQIREIFLVERCGGHWKDGRVPAGEHLIYDLFVVK